MSQDKMQDVHPINFDFKKGEQPTATKLTGWVKQTDTAFSKVTTAVGDPWDVQAFGTPHKLSPARLAQANLARIIGPSDYVSPSGGSFQEPITKSFVVTLKGNRNSWCLGFPLVKVTGTITPNTKIDTNIADLVWGTDLTETTETTFFVPDEVTGGPKANLEDLIEDGDFHIDYFTGVITSYSAAPDTDLEITINNINMLCSSVPWGTHNVIPVWGHVGDTLIHKTTNNSNEMDTYVFEFPLLEEQPRVKGNSALPGTPKKAGEDKAEATLGVQSPGYSSKYRMPYSITSTFTAGQVLPEGFVHLWDNDQSRIVPGCQFKYGGLEDAHATSITIVAPEGWLSSTPKRYRLVVVGTSVSELVDYLSDVVRDNRHIGLNDGALTRGTINYTSPLSHANMTDLHTGDFSDSNGIEIKKLRFRKSELPLNDHPQYLHRYGYASVDDHGNSGNAMRGDLVLSTNFYEDNPDYINYPTYDSFNYDDYPVGSAYLDSYSIYFSGGESSSPSLGFKGTKYLSSWTGGPAHRLGYGIKGAGAVPTLANSYGALTYSHDHGAPLHLRGGTTGFDYAGAVLGFDLGHKNEMNYIKLLPAVRTEDAGVGAEDYPNVPVVTNDNSGNFRNTLSISNLDRRLNAHQLREFRFRGAPYINQASTDSGLLWGQDHLWASPATKYRDSSLGSALSGDQGNTSTITVPVGGIAPTVIGFDSDPEHLLLALGVDSNYAYTFKPGDSVFLNGYLRDFAGDALRTFDGTTPYTIVNVLNYADLTFIVLGIEYISGTVGFVSPGTITVTANEFNSYYPSPGVVGADFVNVYSNAIFFSDQGDGAKTSFTEHGDAWLNRNKARPTGLYYNPATEILMFSYYNPDDDINFFTGKTTRIWSSYNNAIAIDINSKVGGVSIAGESGVSLYSDSIAGGTLPSEYPDPPNDPAQASDYEWMNHSILTYAKNGAIRQRSRGYINLESQSGIVIRHWDGTDRFVTPAQQAYTGDGISNNTDYLFSFYRDNDTDKVAVMESNNDLLIHTTGLKSLSLDGDDYLYMRGRENVTITTTNGGTGAGIAIDTKGGVLIRAGEDRYQSEAVTNEDVIVTADGDIILKAYSDIFMHGLGSMTDGDYVLINSDKKIGFGSYASSRRFKNTINNLEDISWIYDLEPVSYYFNPDFKEDTRLKYGLIAEDVEEVNRNIVNYRDGDVYSVEYQELISVLLKAVQGQKEEIDFLKTRLGV